MVDVDAHRLIRLVRAGRDLRFVWRFALFGTLVWGAFVLSVERSVAPDSAQWARVDADAGPGFVVLLVIAAVALVAQLSLRLAGGPGRAAALLVPPVGTMPAVTVDDGEAYVTGLVPVLGRRAYVGFGVLTAFVVMTIIVVAIVANAWPAFEGNHGRGGRTVTVGRDATVTTQPGRVGSRGGTGTINTLHTADGSADAIGATPHGGERWTIVHDPVSDVDSAYLVGGHAYLLNLLLGLAFLLVDAAIVWFAALVFRAERRRRRSDAHVPLADSYRALAAGGRATVTIGRPAAGYRGKVVPAFTMVLTA